MGRKSSGITAREGVAESFENCNMEKLYATLLKLMERIYDVNITYEYRKKTPEEIARDREENITA